METLTISMRCSHTGGAFTVTFVRPSSSARFRIESIDRPDPSKEMLSLLARARAGAEAHRPAGSSRGRDAAGATHDAASLDWTGWFCPLCRHGSTQGAGTLFVQCSGCRELVCGASVRDLGSGRRTFWCHEGCGHSSHLSGDSIDSYTGAAGARRQALPAAPTRDAVPGVPKRAALPPATKGLQKR
jgi:hypothetical protein